MTALHGERCNLPGGPEVPSYLRLNRWEDQYVNSPWKPTGSPGRFWSTSIVNMWKIWRRTADIMGTLSRLAFFCLLAQICAREFCSATCSRCSAPLDKLASPCPQCSQWKFNVPSHPAYLYAGFGAKRIPICRAQNFRYIKYTKTMFI